MIDGRGANIRELRALFDLGALGDRSDGELLDLCSDRPGPSAELAFEVLVSRHGGMVLGACRRVLDDPHDADDAFQATFLVLASRAGSIRGRDSLASWLYGVALRVASNARRSRARRLIHERKAARREEGRLTDPGGPELARVLAEELARLPDRFRAAVVLCDLEGLSHEEAAQQVGCPPGTIKSRQARGRDRLKSSLARRGLAPSVTSLGLATIAEASPSNVPASLASLTIQAASRVARGDPAVGIASAAAAALTEGTLKAMSLIRWRWTTGALLLLGSASIGVGMATRDETPDAPQTPPTVPARPSPQGGLVKPDREVLREAARAVRPRENSFYTLIEIARAQGRAGDREAAKETASRCLEAAKTLGPQPLLLAAWTLEAVGDHDGAKVALRLACEIVDGLKTLDELQNIWNLALAARADIDRSAGMAESIARFRKLIKERPLVGQQLGPAMSLVWTLAYAGDYPQAFDVADEFGGGDDYYKGIYLGCLAQEAAAEAAYYLQPRRVVTPEARSAALVVLRRVEKIIEPFEFAEQRPDVNLAIAFARLGDFESAHRAAGRIGKGPIRHHHMIDLTAKPYALGAIGVDEGKAGRLDDARRTFREALDLIATDPNLANPTGRSRLLQVGECQVEAGDLDGAFQTIEIMPAQFRPEILDWIGTSRARAGDREGSRSAFRRALQEIDRQVRERGDRATDMEKSQIAAIRAKMGKFEDALKILSTIDDDNSRWEAASELAKARASNGDAVGALAWALSLDPPALRLAVLKGLAEGIGPPGGRDTR